MNKRLLFLGTLLLLGGLYQYVFGAMPNQLKSARMTDSTLLSDLDTKMGELETALADILGITLDADITEAVMTVTSVGLAKVHFIDNAADPSAAGELVRNSTDLLFHDGTSAISLTDSAAVHGLGTGVSVLGNLDAAAEFIQRGSVDPGASGSSQFQVFVTAATAFTFATAFSANARGIVYAGSTDTGGDVVVYGFTDISTTGGTLRGLSRTSGFNPGDALWIGLGD